MADGEDPLQPDERSATEVEEAMAAKAAESHVDIVAGTPITADAVSRPSSGSINRRGSDWAMKDAPPARPGEPVQPFLRSQI